MSAATRTILAAMAIAALSCGRERGAAPPGAAAPPAPVPAAEATAPAPPPVAGSAPVAGEPDAQAAFDVRFGLALAPDGQVVTPVISFAVGDPVCLSVALGAGADAARVALRWRDVEDRPAGEASVATAGDPPRAALCLPGGEKLPRGTYTLEVAADSRPLGSSTFAITDLRQTERAGGA